MYGRVNLKKYFPEGNAAGIMCVCMCASKYHICTCDCGGGGEMAGHDRYLSFVQGCYTHVIIC